MTPRIFVITAAIMTFAASTFAQNMPRTVYGGILNGKALSMPMPEYPEAALNAGVSGMIGVNIIIDEIGSVTEAQADLDDLQQRFDVDGTKLDPLPADPMLRDAAEKAASKAKFAPTLLSGQPIRVKGKIVYNFVAGDKIAEAAAPPPMARSASMAASATLTRQTSGGISGGVLNGKATSLPSPEYPAAARAVRAEGAVAVQIMIDETGTVISAAAVSGHPLLRAASEAAARAAKFSPTHLNGEGVKVQGVLTYNFVP